MSDRLATASARLARRLTDNAAALVTYAREDDSVSLLATIGQTDFSGESDTGARIEWVSRDFIINAADLVLGGETIRPEAGDMITDANGDDYEVLAPARQTPWNWSDRSKIRIRIHTKSVSQT